MICSPLAAHRRGGESKLHPAFWAAKIRVPGAFIIDLPELGGRKAAGKPWGWKSTRFCAFDGGPERPC